MKQKNKFFLKAVFHDRSQTITGDALSGSLIDVIKSWRANTMFACRQKTGCFYNSGLDKLFDIRKCLIKLVKAHDIKVGCFKPYVEQDTTQNKSGNKRNRI
jgi:hypothetical protein